MLSELAEFDVGSITGIIFGVLEWLKGVIVSVSDSFGLPVDLILVGLGFAFAFGMYKRFFTATWIVLGVMTALLLLRL